MSEDLKDKFTDEYFRSQGIEIGTDRAEEAFWLYFGAGEGRQLDDVVKLQGDLGVKQYALKTIQGLSSRFNWEQRINLINKHYRDRKREILLTAKEKELEFYIELRNIYLDVIYKFRDRLLTDADYKVSFKDFDMAVEKIMVLNHVIKALDGKTDKTEKTYIETETEIKQEIETVRDKLLSQGINVERGNNEED